MFTFKSPDSDNWPVTLPNMVFASKLAQSQIAESATRTDRSFPLSDEVKPDENLFPSPCSL